MTLWLVLLLFAILVAAGNTLPLTGTLFARLPLTLFRYPSRVVPFGALAIAALAAIGWDRVRPNRRWVDLILVLIIVVDLLPRERPLFDMAPFSTDIVPYPASIGRAAKIIRMPHGRITNRSIWIAGYLNLYQRRYDAASAAPVINERYLRLHDAVLATAKPQLVNLIGAGYILSDAPIPSLPVVASAGRVQVHLNASVPPVATFWARAVSFASADEALRASIDHPDIAALFVWPPVNPSYKIARPLVMSGSFASIDSRHAHVVVDASRDGILMITQQDAPGWHVFVDGVECAKLLGAGIFRAVEVSSGHHVVEWRFHSASLEMGSVITAITSALLLILHFVKRSSRKKFLDRE